MRLRLSADYADWAIWGPTGLLGEDDLPISDALKNRIKAWLNAYDTNFNRDPSWPMWTPSDAADEEAEWLAEGEAIAGQIRDELGGDCEVLFEAH